MTFAREVLINSMHGVYAPKITNAGVGKLNNSGAITCACRLGVENSESHIHSSRVNQHLPRKGFLSMTLTFIFPTTEHVVINAKIA